MGPGNCCDFTFRSEFVGDIPNMSEVFTAATGELQGGEEMVYPSTVEWNNDLQTDTMIVPSPRQAKLSEGIGSYKYYISSLLLVLINYSSKSVLDKQKSAIISVILTAVFMIGIFCSLREVKEEGKSLRKEKIELLSIRDVDQLVLKKGGVKCECSFLKVIICL